MIYRWVLKTLHAKNLRVALFKKQALRDYPGSPVVKNPSSNAGDVGSIPGQGTKIPHAAGS